MEIDNVANFFARLLAVFLRAEKSASSRDRFVIYWKLYLSDGRRSKMSPVLLSNPRRVFALIPVSYPTEVSGTNNTLTSSLPSILGITRLDLR
eukprot:UN02556